MNATPHITPQETHSPSRGHGFGDINVHGGNAHLGDVYNTYNYWTSPSEREERYLNTRAFYFDSINDRRDQIVKARDGTCEWVWATNLGDWLKPDSQQTSKVFWISGKPGSGKSTLMKYLATVPKLRDIIRNSGQAWEILSFFFDFRMGENIQNNADGLRRTLLDQLQILRPRLFTTADVRPLHTSISETPGHFYGEMMAELLERSGLKFLIFIDGLDEFTGNIRELVTRDLLPLQGDRVKLCLASRRNTTIQQVLRDQPNLHVSDPQLNEIGIQQHIQHVIATFDGTESEILGLAEIQKSLHEKAEGVFLWVVLALGEIVQACADGATRDEIKQLLEILPQDLESLYQRILDRIPVSKKLEAAVMYCLVASARFRISLGLLQSAIYFMTIELGLQPLPPLDLSEDQLCKRLLGSLGGLVEVCHPSTIISTESHDGTPEVRLLHETVRSFTQKSNWIDRFLPSLFRENFPNNAWPRLGCRALSAANAHVQPQDIILPEPRFHHDVSYKEFQSVLSTAATGSIIKWGRLLYYAIKHVVLHAERDHNANDPIYDRNIETALREPMAGLHVPMFEHHIKEWVDELVHNHGMAMDTVLACIHICQSYLSSRLSRLASLTNAQRQLLILGSLSSSGEFYGYNCLSDIGFHQVGPAKDNMVRRFVSLILECDDEVSSFHLAMFLRLGFAPTPKFLSQHRHKVSRLTQWPCVETMPFAVKGALYEAEPPLFIWVCEYRLNNPELGMNAASQLEVLLDFGSDINSRSAEGFPIVHYLISKHMLEHAYFDDHTTCWAPDDPLQSIEKLYLLEAAGADLEVEFRAVSPLQAVQDGRRRLKDLCDIDDQKVHGLDSSGVDTRLEQLEDLLKHRRQYGHLPRPLVDFVGERIGVKSPHHCGICANRAKSRTLPFVPRMLNRDGKTISSSPPAHGSAVGECPGNFI